MCRDLKSWHADGNQAQFAGIKRLLCYINGTLGPISVVSSHKFENISTHSLCCICYFYLVTLRKCALKVEKSFILGSVEKVRTGHTNKISCSSNITLFLKFFWTFVDTSKRKKKFGLMTDIFGWVYLCSGL